MKSTGLRNVGENLWVLEFPVRLLGTAIGRRSTVIRLSNAQVMVHSSAPFQPDDVTAISALGAVEYLIEVSQFHDTFSREGTAAFPQARFFAPPGFNLRGKRGSRVESLANPPPEWAPDVEVQQIEGMPSVNEFAVLHKPSRTLIVADVVFNMSTDADAWTAFFFRYLAGTFGKVGMSRMFRFSIRDRAAFCRSMERIVAWDFDRLITGHGEIVARGGKAQLQAALESAVGWRSR